MYVFIDESGTFTGYHDLSVSVVGALAIPDYKMNRVVEKYAKLRQTLPKENGEVKGRLLTESQVDRVVGMLARNDVIFEVSVLDLGYMTENGALRYKEEHVTEMLGRVSKFRSPDRELVEKAASEMQRTSLPLYLQALLTFETLHNIISHVPLYFAQRRAIELAKFVWVVDAKQPDKVTRWEMWWSWFARGALASMSKRRPAPRFDGADFSSFDQAFSPRSTRENDLGADLSLLLADLRFSSTAEPGIELADIVTNATRRALTNTLAREGWRQIPKLMIHRNSSYLQLTLYREGPDGILNPSYANIVRYFSTGGKPMLTPSISRRFAEELDGET